jgi:hypothetical protein
VVFKTLQKILGAMGYALKDLATESDTVKPVKGRKGKAVFIERERMAY